jgi:hypothetical protein
MMKKILLVSILLIISMFMFGCDYIDLSKLSTGEFSKIININVADDEPSTVSHVTEESIDLDEEIVDYENCEDEDSGINIYYRAELIYNTPDGEREIVTDRCISNFKVEEYVCTDYGYKRVNMNCPSGYLCKDGICVGSDGYTCEDEDGNDVYVKDITFQYDEYGDIVNSYSDGCFVNSLGVLKHREGVCVNGHAMYKNTICPSGYVCADSVCKKEFDRDYICGDDICSNYDCGEVIDECDDYVNCGGCSNDEFCENNHCYEKNDCEDPDGGKDIYTYSQLRSVHSDGGVSTPNDLCHDSNSVREYTCTNRGFTSEVIDCPTNYVCKNGACVEEEDEEIVCNSDAECEPEITKYCEDKEDYSNARIRTTRYKCGNAGTISSNCVYAGMSDYIENVCAEDCADGECIGEILVDECQEDSDCDDNDPSTDDDCWGIPVKVCEHDKITYCYAGDDYCPTGCNYANDPDCEEDDDGELSEFDQAWVDCTPAEQEVVAIPGELSYHYGILGPKDGMCEIETYYPDNLNPGWEGKTMTCLYDNSKDFSTAVEELIESFNTDNPLGDCSGELYELIKMNYE